MSGLIERFDPSEIQFGCVISPERLREVLNIFPETAKTLSDAKEAATRLFFRSLEVAREIEKHHEWKTGVVLRKDGSILIPTPEEWEKRRTEYAKQNMSDYAERMK